MQDAAGIMRVQPVETLATTDKTAIDAQWRNDADAAWHCDLFALVVNGQVGMEMGLEHLLA
ncbi:MAG: hypothetical protein B7Z11_06360 [Acidovorax sp. 32-64-7]|nr:MAG: hypothetical protein B7Z11_06360 [Acidovorax sp. 32-64-7]